MVATLPGCCSIDAQPMNSKPAQKRAPLKESISHGFIRAEGKLKYTCSPLSQKERVHSPHEHKCGGGSPKHQLFETLFDPSCTYRPSYFAFSQ